MKNLIKNSRWRKVDPCSGPLCFTQSMIKLNCFCRDGYRTSSVCLDACETGCQQYDVRIPINPGDHLMWGYIMRAIELHCVYLKAEFYDACDVCIEAQCKEITRDINEDFKRVMMRFTAPCDACYVLLSIHFEGVTSACTFYAPYAYYTL